MKALYKLFLASTAVLLLASCENKPLGWPGEDYFDQSLYPTNLQDDLSWPNPDNSFVSLDESVKNYLKHFFFDNKGNLVHFGVEEAFDPSYSNPAINSKNHIDKVPGSNPGEAGVDHYNGKYNVFVSDHLLLDYTAGNNPPLQVRGAEAVTSVELSQSATSYTSYTVPVNDFGFCGMDCDRVYRVYKDSSFYAGFTLGVKCGTNTPHEVGVYETTHAPVAMKKYIPRVYRVHILNDVTETFSMNVVKYAFMDGLKVFDLKALLQGKEAFSPCVQYLGCNESGEWVVGSSYSFQTDKAVSIEDASGNIYLFCDFVELATPGTVGSSDVVRIRICKVIPYDSLITPDGDGKNYSINLNSDYISGMSMGVGEIIDEYCPGGSWRTDVTYPITKVIK